MWNFYFVLFIFMTFFVKGNDADLQNFHRTPKYWGESTERLLQLCSPNTACNIIHDRIWFLPKVVQLCVCGGLSRCPQTWSDGNDHTLFINHRAQLKFCDPVTNLPECTNERAALTSQVKNYSTYARYAVEVKCRCPKFHYFGNANSNVSDQTNSSFVITETRSCQKLQDCATGDFCGHITSRHYQTYHRCTCPQHHLCLIGEDRNTSKIKEALYEGDAYRGVCVPQ